MQALAYDFVINSMYSFFSWLFVFNLLSLWLAAALSTANTFALIWGKVKKGYISFN